MHKLISESYLYFSKFLFLTMYELILKEILFFFF